MPRGAVEIRTGYRSFAALEGALGKHAGEVAFAMNAGMFDEAGAPIGLMVEDGREEHAINRREGGGNFHLMPNGVFVVRDNGDAAVIPSAKFTPSEDIAFATQSGPMLVIAGELHPKFEADGTSRYVRNAVGIGPNGVPLFVISVEAVSFGKLARFYRDRLNVREALYLDGSVSSMWDPANGRMDSLVELGPIAVVFKPGAGSAPRREGPATP
ncbi:MAG: phosphodiester glycosidase family protein [Pseudomonadota bacterium]|nr:phosphodiester glycosidase family protein [Pseudomonadota bacterium]